MAENNLKQADVIEGATVLLGHELTWFGGLSSAEAAAVRYGLLLLAVVLVVAAALRRRRDR